MSESATVAAPSPDDASTIDASEPKTNREKLLASAISMSACGFMYLLMSGPVAFLHKNIPAGPFRSVVEILFAPIIFVLRNDIEPLSTVVKAYVGLFT